MTRACCSALLFLTACSPEGGKQASAAASTEGTDVVTPIKAGDYPVEPDAVPYKQLGWDSENRLLLLDGKPFTGVTTDFYKKTGKLKLRYEVKDGVYNGWVQEWYENGQQTMKTHYVNRKHEGDNYYWNPDGTLQVHKVWKGDILITETPGP